jgi:hypothetical protein
MSERIYDDDDDQGVVIDEYDQDAGYDEDSEGLFYVDETRGHVQQDTEQESWAKSLEEALQYRASDLGIDIHQKESDGLSIVDVIERTTDWKSERIKLAHLATLDDILLCIEERKFGMFVWLAIHMSGAKSEISKKGSIMNNAVRTGDLKYVKVALLCGAKSNIREHPSLHPAILFGMDEIVGFLIEKDKNIIIEQQDKIGNTALHVALQNASGYEIIKKILEFIYLRDKFEVFGIKNKMNQYVADLVVQETPELFPLFIRLGTHHFLENTEHMNSVIALIIKGNFVYVEMAVLSLLKTNDPVVTKGRKLDHKLIRTFRNFLEIAVVNEQHKIAEFLENILGKDSSSTSERDLDAKSPTRERSVSPGYQQARIRYNEARFEEDTKRAILLSLGEGNRTKSPDSRSPRNRSPINRSAGSRPPFKHFGVGIATHSDVLSGVRTGVNSGGIAPSGRIMSSVGGAPAALSAAAGTALSLNRHVVRSEGVSQMDRSGRARSPISRLEPVRTKSPVTRHRFGGGLLKEKVASREETVSPLRVGSSRREADLHVVPQRDDEDHPEIRAMIRRRLESP